MSARQEFAWLGFWLGQCACAAAAADTPQDAARKAMDASVARQRQAVAAMQVSIEKQRTAVAAMAAGAQPAGHGTDAEAAPIAFFTLSWPALGSACDPLPEIELTPLIQHAAQQEGLDANLLRAVAQQESGFRSCAVSPKGAMGLMQLMPATAQELGVHDPFDPAESLSSGARLLKQLLARFGGDTALALGAYNAGPERVEESGGVPQIPETIRYVQQILSKLPIP
ncbi:MAG TPA: lytic transglycosylase domain-containing protein [Bryobacteraceae bacterium]|nr:lytic transglycosylase domain-containing protein [Bryobacteraceae bacterium]